MKPGLGDHLPLDSCAARVTLGTVRNNARRGD